MFKDLEFDESFDSAIKDAVKIEWANVEDGSHDTHIYRAVRDAEDDSNEVYGVVHNIEDDSVDDTVILLGKASGPNGKAPNVDFPGKDEINLNGRRDTKMFSAVGNVEDVSIKDTEKIDWANGNVEDESHEIKTIKWANDKVEDSMIGKKVSVFWPVDNSWYVGTVQQFNASSGEHLLKYEDGDTEWVQTFECDKVEDSMIGKKVSVFCPVDNSWYVGIVQQFNASTGEHLLKYEDGDTEWVQLGESNLTMNPTDLHPQHPHPSIPRHSTQTQGSHGSKMIAWAIDWTDRKVEGSSRNNKTIDWANRKVKDGSQVFCAVKKAWEDIPCDDDIYLDNVAKIKDDPLPSTAEENGSIDTLSVETLNEEEVLSVEEENGSIETLSASEKEELRKDENSFQERKASIKKMLNGIWSSRKQNIQNYSYSKSRLQDSSEEEERIPFYERKASAKKNLNEFWSPRMQHMQRLQYDHENAPRFPVYPHMQRRQYDHEKTPRFPVYPKSWQEQHGLKNSVFKPPEITPVTYPGLKGIEVDKQVAMGTAQGTYHFDSGCSLSSPRQVLLFIDGIRPNIIRRLYFVFDKSQNTIPCCTPMYDGQYSLAPGTLLHEYNLEETESIVQIDVWADLHGVSGIRFHSDSGFVSHIYGAPTETTPFKSFRGAHPHSKLVGLHGCFGLHGGCFGTKIEKLGFTFTTDKRPILESSEEEPRANASAESGELGAHARVQEEKSEAPRANSEEIPASITAIGRDGSAPCEKAKAGSEISPREVPLEEKVAVVHLGVVFLLFFGAAVVGPDAPNAVAWMRGFAYLLIFATMMISNMEPDLKATMGILMFISALLFGAVW